MINNLLLLETFENQNIEMDMQPENIYELVQSTLKDFSADETQQVVNECGHLYINGDRHYLSILLKTMVTNALQRAACTTTPRVVLSTPLAPDK